VPENAYFTLENDQLLFRTTVLLKAACSLRRLFLGCLSIAMSFWLLSSTAKAESPRQDSLRTAAQGYNTDTTALRSLLKLAQSYFGSNLDSALVIGERAGSAAKAGGWDEFVAQSENTMGIARLFQGKNRESLVHFEAVLKIREAQGNPRLIAKALNNVALSHQELGNPMLALDCHIRSLKLKEELGDSASIRITYNNIGLIYEQLTDFDMARSYYRKALGFFPIQQDSMAHATNCFNIGVTYFSEMKNDSAADWFSQSLPLVQKMGDLRMIGLHQLHFGVIAQRKGDYEGARTRIEEALKIFRGIGKLDQVAASLAYLGMNYLDTGDPKRAFSLCEEGLQFAREAENPSREVDCLDCLHRSSAALSRPADAYRYSIAYHHLQDSMSRFDIHQQIVRKDLEYSFKKEQLADSMETARTNEFVRMTYENKIKRQGILTISLVVVGGLLLGLVLLFYSILRNRKRQGFILEERVKARTAQLEQQRDRLAEYAFINAHLIRQPLTQVMGLIAIVKSAESEEERTKYLELLEQASQKLDNVIHEIRDVVESDRLS
jgi:tetratricopeptide (TPR) repeat protein